MLPFSQTKTLFQEPLSFYLRYSTPIFPNTRFLQPPHPAISSPAQSTILPSLHHLLSPHILMSCCLHCITASPVCCLLCIPCLLSSPHPLSAAFTSPSACSCYSLTVPSPPHPTPHATPPTPHQLSPLQSVVLDKRADQLQLLCRASLSSNASVGSCQPEPTTNIMPTVTFAKRRVGQMSRPASNAVPCFISLKRQRRFVLA